MSRALTYFRMKDEALVLIFLNREILLPLNLTTPCILSISALARELELLLDIPLHPPNLGLFTVTNLIAQYSFSKIYQCKLCAGKTV